MNEKEDNLEEYELIEYGLIASINDRNYLLEAILFLGIVALLITYLIQ